MKANSKILASALALGLAGVTTVGSTYAWFTTNGSATVSNISMTVESDTDGIYVAPAKSTAWNNNINLTSKYTDISLAPCTSVNGKDFYKLDGCTANAVGTASVFNYSSLAKEGASSSKTGWIKQGDTLGTDFYYCEETFYILVDESSTKITMTPNLSITGNAKAGSVARFSVTTPTDFATNATTTTVGCFGTLSGETRISNRDGVDNALDAYNALHGLDDVTNGKIKDNKGTGMTGWSSDSQFNVDPAQAVTLTVGEANTFAQFQTNTGADNALNVSASGVYRYTYLTIGIWFEGNDYNCYNSVAGAQLGVSLSFTATSN